MGKLEKVIVLTVLFLVAAILGVSLNSESGVAEASSTPVTKTQPSTAGDLARAGGLPQAEKPAGTRRRRGAQAPLSAEQIRAALDAAGGVKTRAAELLGLRNRFQLLRLLKKHNIH